MRLKKKKYSGKKMRGKKRCGDVMMGQKEMKRTAHGRGKERREENKKEIICI